MSNFKFKKHKKAFAKFILLLAILIAYFAYLSWKYDFATGGVVAAITWSFFVLCTPIADAGFLLDFPLRLLFKIKMIFTEITVWILAFTINIFTLNFRPEYYETTILTNIFHKILTNPIPYWSIILLCGAGTFLSVYFGDEILDSVQRKKSKHRKYHMIISIILFIFILFAYYSLIKKLEINIEQL